MEKLILHLSPVTRRKSLRNSNSAPNTARRTLSEPNKNRMLLLNSGSGGRAQQQHHNSGLVKKASLSSDLKAVAVSAVHEVQSLDRGLRLESHLVLGRVHPT